MSDSDQHQLVPALVALTHAVNLLTSRIETHKSPDLCVLVTLLGQMECRLTHHIMTASESIAAYKAAVDTAYDTIGASVDKIVKSQAGIQSDVAALKKTIADIQNSPGTLSPADQTSLDEAQARVAQLSTKVENVATALAALDEETAEVPEVPPTV